RRLGPLRRRAVEKNAVGLRWRAANDRATPAHIAAIKLDAEVCTAHLGDANLRVAENVDERFGLKCGSTNCVTVDIVRQRPRNLRESETVECWRERIIRSVEFHDPCILNIG